jgi:hypothetical protein
MSVSRSTRVCEKHQVRIAKAFPTVTELIDELIEYNSKQNRNDYLRRGRRFAGLNLCDLNKKFVSAFSVSYGPESNVWFIDWIDAAAEL